jgi:hypothetical protein
MSIKKYLIVLACLSMFACSKHDWATISGKIENYGSGEMSYLEEMRVSGNHLIDSSEIKNSGRFRHSFNLKKTGYYQLTFSTGESLTLIVSPDEKIHIIADSEDFYKTKIISGSPATERLNVLHDSLRSTIARLNNIRDVYEKMADTNNLPNDQREELYRQYFQLREAHHKLSVGFILEDLKSLSNIAALYQEYAPNDYVFNKTKDLQYYKLVSDTLMKYFPDVRYVKSLSETSAQLINEYNTLRLLKTKDPISHDVPDLNLPSNAGRDWRLSSVKAKLVLLTFWSVDQQESIQNMLDLKEIYSKYQNRDFEIYQVSVDKSFANFKKRVAFEELKWISVIDTTFPDSQTRYLYNVNTLPMNYLLDMNRNVILAKNLSPEMLEQSIQFLLTQRN